MLKFSTINFKILMMIIANVAFTIMNTANKKTYSIQTHWTMIQINEPITLNDQVPNPIWSHSLKTFFFKLILIICYHIISWLNSGYPSKIKLHYLKDRFSFILFWWFNAPYWLIPVPPKVYIFYLLICLFWTIYQEFYLQSIAIK